MKAILVIDEPNECIDCPCYRQTKEDGELFEDCKAMMMPLNWREVTEKPIWCPLKPMPTKITTATLSEREQERTELFTSMALLKTYADGWNDCLKGIADD